MFSRSELWQVLMGFNNLICFAECTPSEYKCHSGHCIEGHRRCDHVPDCPDGDDEDSRCRKYYLQIIFPKPLYRLLCVIYICFFQDLAQSSLCFFCLYLLNKDINILKSMIIDNYRLDIDIFNVYSSLRSTILQILSFSSKWECCVYSLLGYCCCVSVMLYYFTTLQLNNFNEITTFF